LQVTGSELIIVNIHFKGVTGRTAGQVNKGNYTGYSAELFFHRCGFTDNNYNEIGMYLFLFVENKGSRVN
jgi:hypothetical protein